MNQTYIELPIQRFIGGNSEVYVYEILDAHSIPIDLSGATARFALSNFSTKTVVVSKACEIIQEASDIVPYPYKVQVVLDTADTIGLHGEFIQQLTLADVFGKQKRPAEGRIIVTRNTEPIEVNRFWYDDVQEGSFFATPECQPLPVGSSYNVRLFYPSKSTQKISAPVYSQITFASTDPAVAQVFNSRTNSGGVTAVGVGQCEIYATATARPSIYAKILVTVEQPNTRWYKDIKPDTFRAVPAELTLAKGSVTRASLFYTSEAIDVDLSPTYTELLFESDNESIATVDGNGLIFAADIGTCGINVRLLAMNGVETRVIVDVF